MSAAFEPLAHANKLLRQLRSNTDSPERVLAELRQSGCTVSVDGERLVVRGTIAPHLRERIMQFREAMIGVLRGHASPMPPEPWDQAAARAMCKMIFHRFERNGRTDDPAERQKLAALFDAIDLAFLDKDMRRLKAAVAACSDHLNASYPRQQDGGVRYGPLPPDQPSFTGWIRLRKKDGWLPIATEVTDRRACSEMLSEYAAMYSHCDTTVLPTGEDPNK